jgi:hypothetical protein
MDAEGDKIRRLAADEEVFRRWYNAWANRTGMHPDPDHPEHRYDYRAAYQSGSQPDADLHWPSRFKHDDHANRFIDGVDTKYGRR